MYFRQSEICKNTSGSNNARFEFHSSSKWPNGEPSSNRNSFSLPANAGCWDYANGKDDMPRLMYDTGKYLYNSGKSSADNAVPNANQGVNVFVKGQDVPKILVKLEV
jgi:hypothetical protein